MDIQQWIAENNLSVQIEQSNKIFTLDNKRYLLLSGVDNKIIGQDSVLLLNQEDIQFLNQYEVDRFVFEFGDKYCYVDDKDIKFIPTYDEFGQETGDDPIIDSFKDFLYIGEPSVEFNDLSIPYLGVHGAYDLCNGSRSYNDWCKKAKWLGIKHLGICEDGTLSGTLTFQQSCKDNDIKSIIGETLMVKHNDAFYQIKLYCIDKQGWKNLTTLNYLHNNKDDKWVTHQDVLEYHDGLICILTPNCNLKNIYKDYLKVYGDNLYYQLDFVEWINNTRDKEWLNNITIYLKHYLQIIKPIILCDSYYLEQRDNAIQPILWSIGKGDGLKYYSKDRYFKNIDQILLQGATLFKDENQWIVEQAITNTQDLVKNIDFEIPIGNKYLPKYKMKDEEKDQFDNSSDLLLNLIEIGLQQKIIEKGLDVEPYLNRIEEELRVIRLGDVEDYFLIVWDILNYCHKNKILVGTGRGSAAGCLISYLLGIVQVNPLQYDLLFERFLNEGRVGKSLPDIDNDVQGSRRDEVKRYIEQRYGVDHVAGIGTYGTFKVRAGLKDLIRELGGESMEANYISAILDENDSFEDVIKKCVSKDVNKRLYKFVQKHAFQLNYLPLLFKQPKTQSIHAAGVIIVPDSGGSIETQLPVKKMDGITITEWEGSLLEDAGYLKVDILGLRQLDKFSDIIELIKQFRNQEIVLNDIPLDDKQVYEFFSQGFNEDVFQFGGDGLKGYSKELKPNNIEDLIATVALYRPGPIEIGAHTKYANIKNGLEQLEYQPGLEEITQPTYSQIVYQEQIMLIVQHLGGFTLVEADDIRKAMGKKKADLMTSYKERFINGAVERGLYEEDAVKIWFDMEGFAGYAFNKSHATCYAITGYYCQWLKYHYPLEFWLTSLKYSSNDQLPSRIAEIKNIASNIDIVGPDVIKSRVDYFGDMDTQTIYWSLNSISHIAQAGVDELLILREQNNNYFASFEDFYLALENRKQVVKEQLKQQGKRLYYPINKRSIVHMIISGAFDNLESIKKPSERFNILQKFFILLEPKLEADPLMIEEELWIKVMGQDLWNTRNWHDDHIWIIKQKELCGFGTLDFKSLVDLTENHQNYKMYFLTNQHVNETNTSEKEKKALCGGIVNDIKVRNSRNGEFVQLLIHDGTEELYMTIWSEVFELYKESLLQSIGKILYANGVILHDSFRNKNVFHSKSTTKISIL